MARADGKLDKARKLIDKATRLATLANSTRGSYFAAVERARVERAAGQPLGQGDAAAKGRLRADPWQLANDIVLGLSFAGRKAA
mgnify:CR=1 FL=1